MPGLADALQGHAVVGLDTPIFIYQLEGVRPYFRLTFEFFEMLSRGSLQAVTSVLTLMEVAVRPLRMGRPGVADDYESLVTSYPNLAVLPVDGSIARRAAELRATYRLTALDAVQVASAIAAGATVFLSNDHELHRVMDIRVVLLDDLLPAN